jgi:tripartite ATP-independent transporter DctP family solute receptor
MTRSNATHGFSGNSRRRLLKGSLAAAATACTVGLPSIVRAQRVRTFRFGSPTPPGSIYNQAMELFVSEVHKQSGDKLKVELYPSSQLGSIKDMLQAVQLGTQSIGMAVPAWYSGFAKQMDVFSLPFIIGSEDRLRAALTGPLGKEIDRQAEAVGFKILGFWTMGPRQLVNTVRPIRRPEDLRGLKIRVINSPVFLQTFRTLGANPVGLDSAEMYLALQQKTVDGADNAATDIVNLKLYEVTKYLSLTGTIFDFFAVSMNKALWDGLGADEKKIFTDAMNKSMEWEWKAQPAAVKVATDRLKGILQWNDITNAEREEFVKATAPVYQQFEPTIGKDLLAQAIKALGLA